MPHRKIIRSVWRNLAVVALLFAAVAMIAGAVENNNRIDEIKALALANKSRTKEIRMNQKAIQQSRVESCQRTYEGVRQVFDPFLPKHPRGEEARRLRQFNDNIDMLKLGCVTQTKPRRQQ